MSLHNRSEQIPNPESRVSLTRDRDALGVHRVQLDWKLSRQDKRLIRRFHEILAEEVGRSGIGRLRIVFHEEDPWPDTLRFGSHHMGTTRMHASPRKGVVDADCRVHDVRNLFVAGSSVFPTCGHANPTLTIVALALRLADHLKTRLS